MGLTKYKEEGELDFGLSEGQSLLKVKGGGNQWRLEVKEADEMRRCHNKCDPGRVVPEFFYFDDASLGQFVPFTRRPYS
jgi:hypothetical protein